MSQENVEIVRRSYEAYERGDLTGMLTAADPDLITHRAAPQPDAGTWHGREGFLQAFASWIEDFDAFALTVEELIDANDTQVIARLHQRAVGSESGVRSRPIFGSYTPSAARGSGGWISTPARNRPSKPPGFRSKRKHAGVRCGPRSHERAPRRDGARRCPSASHVLLGSEKRIPQSGAKGAADDRFDRGHD